LPDECHTSPLVRLLFSLMFSFFVSASSAISSTLPLRVQVIVYRNAGTGLPKNDCECRYLMKCVLFKNMGNQEKWLKIDLTQKNLLLTLILVKVNLHR
jgi:hypothetical protein